MRLTLSTVGLLLLVLLTWLLLRGIDTRAPTYAATLRALDDFALAEASLHRDVLQARAGLLRNYDSMGKALGAMREAVARLQSYARMEDLDAAPGDRLTTTVAQQEDLVEHFKSSNAVLQNSLSYIGQLSTTPAFGAPDPWSAAAAGALAASILHLTRDAASESIEALQQGIDRFAAHAPSAGPDAQAAQALLAHARLLRDALPAVDETLKALVAVPSPQALEETRALFAEHQTAVEASAQRFRLLLYLASLLLVVALLRLGLQLRARALALRRRAEFEHVIAENSTRLINCPPADTEERLKQVVGEFGRAVGAQRAYVVLDENPIRVHAWCADGAANPPGWPDQALELYERLGRAGPDIVTVPHISSLPPGEIREALAAFEVYGWVCVPLIRAARVQGIMGFDSLHPVWDGAFPVPVVRLAGDAVANAIEREFLERDRERLATRLERARRMQTIGSLASGIAHNFNNIIGAILGYSEIVESRLSPGMELVEHIEEIRRAAERGRDLIDRILTFGRRRDVRVQPVQVRTLLREAGSLLRASLPRGVEFLTEVSPVDLAVSGEPAQLQQVILNLSTNAAEAMESSGCIHVTAEQRDVTDPCTLSHGELAPGRYVCIAVSDTGRGFEERVARRLFEPFFTTRLAGTGLGLATVHEIVRDHNGAMNVHSKPGHGSRFEAWLPAVTAESVAAAWPAVLPLGRGETVLVIESERERLLGIEEMLAALGYEPVGFERPTDAIAACRSAPDRFDVIVICHAPPKANDLDLVQALHELVPQRPILLATGSTTDVSVDALAEAGVSELLGSPLISTEVAAALARGLRSPVLTAID
jgi:signal transduction histidine kinase